MPVYASLEKINKQTIHVDQSLNGINDKSRIIPFGE
jgi:hypothetical protein